MTARKRIVELSKRVKALEEWQLALVRDRDEAFKKLDEAFVVWKANEALRGSND